MMLRPYQEVGALELTPLQQQDASGSSSDAPRRWRLPRHELSEPRVQRRLWMAAGALVLLLAGVAAAVQTAAQHGTAPSRHSSRSSSSRTQAPRPFPAEPFLAPSRPCRLDVAVAPSGIDQPLSYSLHLDLSDPSLFLAQAGGGGGELPERFPAASNLTLSIAENTSCLSLHASNLSFGRIEVSLVLGEWDVAAGAPKELAGWGGAAGPVCLCGPADSSASSSSSACLTSECGRLFKARPGAGPDAWLLSLGPLSAPAGSTLLLSTAYSAAVFKGGQGLWRSSSFPAASSSSRRSSSRRGRQLAEHVALTTEFEMTAARRVLPCMDEPALKATFDVSVLAPAGLTVLSNMINSSSSSSDSTTQLVHFEPTPPMSTYLLSVVAGRLAAVSAHTSSQQLVRVWVAPGDVAGAKLPLRWAVAALEHYEAFTGWPQSRGAGLTKWDLVAVPGKSGAVENWGLLLFDPERLLLPRGAASSAWARFRSANVICHELGHQWFGNLVTAATWNSLLVNEGLATLVEYGCMASVLELGGSPAGGSGGQLGGAGAALLMQGMFGGPAGLAAGRLHEGPFARTLDYDASPLAQPLLGAAQVAFDVPVYSKAASVMAATALYAALAGAGAGGGGAGQPGGSEREAAAAFGPVAGVLSARSPQHAGVGHLQAVLRQHLAQHAFGTAYAHDVLASVIALAPAALSSNAASVLAGLQSPGSPLLQVVAATAQGLTVRQRRFCAWGLLQPRHLEAVLAHARDGGEHQVATPPINSSALLCPAFVEGRDRSVPWTPVRLLQLPRAARGANSSSTAAVPCAATWHVVMQDEQTLAVPQGDAACGAANSSLDMMVLEGDGGFGLFWGLYPPRSRAALRRWVATELPGLLVSSAQQQTAPQQLSQLQLLALASKLLRTQASLALSAFGEVPGWEALAALEAAVNATSGLQRHTAARRPESNLGFGAALYALVAPLLPSLDVLLDRLAADQRCCLHQQHRVARLLRPLAAAALATFGGSSSEQGGSEQGSSSTDEFLGGLALDRLLALAGRVDPATTKLLCARFNAAAAAHSADEVSEAPYSLLDGLPANAQHAMLAVAAAAPPGCTLDWSGEQLQHVLRQWLLGSRDAGVSNTAALALAHLPARAAGAPSSWQHTLELLLGLGSDSTPSPPASPHAAARASGIAPAKHAAELAVLLSRAVGSAGSKLLEERSADQAQPDRAEGAGAVASAVSHPVTAFLAANWPRVLSQLGARAAWVTLREVAAREVVTAPQWRSLAAWLARQPAADGAPKPAQHAAALGAVWSSVVWVEQHTRGALCN